MIGGYDSAVHTHSNRLPVPRFPSGHVAIRDIKDNALPIHEKPPLARVAMHE